MNYYPQAGAWKKMWTSFDASQIQKDFSLIHRMGFNAVRINIPLCLGSVSSTNCTPTTNVTPGGSYTANLQTMLNLAAANGLGVRLGLFDLSIPFDDIPHSESWALALLSPFANDKRILFIDLYNEMNTRTGLNPSAVPWAQAVAAYIRTFTSTPLTVSTNDYLSGVSNWKANSLTLDLFEVHFYSPKPEMAYSVFKLIKEQAGNTPFFIGESGYSTFDSSASTPTCDSPSVYIQDQFFRTVEAAAKDLNIPFVAPWILYDFPATAMDAVSFTGQNCYGLIRLDGTPKPAYGSLTNQILNGTIDPSFNNGFETEGAPRLPANWVAWQPMGSQATYARDTTTFHSGAASASLSGTVSSASGTPSFYTAPIQPIVSGATYTLSAWVRGQAVTGRNDIAIAWFDLNSKYLSTSVSPYVPTGNSDWRQIFVSASPPAEAAFCEIHLQSAGNSGQVWFDDVAWTSQGGF